MLHILMHAMNSVEICKERDTLEDFIPTNKNKGLKQL